MALDLSVSQNSQATKPNAHSQPSQSTQESQIKGVADARFEKKLADFAQFMTNVDDVAVRYNCSKCGEERCTWVFNRRRYQLGRTCADNIDMDIADSCRPEEKNACVVSDPPRYYSNWDMEFEYATEWEHQNGQFFTGKWQQWNITENMTDARSICVQSRLKTKIEFDKRLIELKKSYFKDQCGIENVNMFILNATLRRLDFYLQCLNYYDLMNKYGGYQLQCTDYGVCHGCGMKWYLPTQYERSYVDYYARKVMNLVNYHVNNNDEDNVFICCACVHSAYRRIRDRYYDMQKYSLMYRSEWSGVKKKDHVLFGLAHLNHRKYPIHMAWYDMTEESWCHGKIEKVVDPSAYTVLVSRVGFDNAWNKRQVICFSTRTEEEYFLYQRPSTPRSPLYTQPAYEFVKLLPELQVIIDTTSPQFTDYWRSDKMYENNIETIKLNWKFLGVNKGEFGELVFIQCMHMKKMYDMLKQYKCLKQVNIVDLDEHKKKPNVPYNRHQYH